MLALLMTQNVAAIISDNWISVLVAAILAIGGSGGIVALFRSRGEKSKIIVDAAQGAVILQSGVIDSLQEEIVRLQDKTQKQDLEIERQDLEIAELRSHLIEVNSLRARVRELEQDNEVLKAENTKLQSEVRELQRITNGNN